MNGGVLLTDFGGEFGDPLIGLVREVERVVGLRCPSVQRTGLTRQLESVNSHEEGVVERTDHGTNTATQIACIHVDVVNTIVPIRFL